MQPERRVVGVYTDRQFLVWALERITEGEFRCVVLPQNGRPEPATQGAPADWPLAIIVDCQTGVFEQIRRLSVTFPRVPLVVWQRSKGSERSLNALDWGAAGILHDNCVPNDVLVCLKSVSQGEAFVPDSVAQAASRSRRCHLSKREEQLLRLVVQGLRNKEIAYLMSISEGTVKVYFSRLFHKLGVSDRYELALLGLRHCGPDSVLSGKDEGHPSESDPLNSIYIHKSVGWASWEPARSNISRL